jgi:hypothetical protein
MFQRHCPACGLSYSPAASPGGKELHCAGCTSALRPGSAPPGGVPHADRFLGRTIAGVRIQRRMALRWPWSVYEGRHERLRTRTRVKLLPSRLAEDRRYYVRETFGRVASALPVRDLHVVAVLDLGRTEEFLFIVTEFVPRSLASVMAPGRPLPVQRAVHWLGCGLRALAALDEVGALHGGIDPDGLLIGPEGSAKLDHPRRPMPEEFNLLLVTEDGLITSPAYCVAPERAVDERAADIRSDLYSLGALAYHMLSGLPVFDARSAQEVMDLHIGSPRPDLRARAPGVSPELADFVMRLLSTDPAGRPASPAAALEELEGLSQARGAAAGAPTPAAGAPEPAGRARPAIWVAVTVLLVVAAAAPFVVLRRWHRVEQEAVAVSHRRLSLVVAALRGADSPSDDERSGLDALLRYHLGFYPELEVMDRRWAEEADGQGLAAGCRAAGSAYLFLVTYGSGLGRRNWTVRFLDLGSGVPLARQTCSVPDGSEEWSVLEASVAGALATAARALGVAHGVQDGSVTGLSGAGWLSLAEAERAERGARWKEAVDTLADPASAGGPGAVLALFYETVGGLEQTGELRPTRDVPPEGLSPELAGLALALRAVRTGVREEVHACLGDYLARVPGSARGYYLLGLWRFHAEGKVAESLVTLKHALGVDPSYLPAAYACVDVLAGGEAEEMAGFLEWYGANGGAAEDVKAVTDRARRAGSVLDDIGQS